MKCPRCRSAKLMAMHLRTLHQSRRVFYCSRCVRWLRKTKGRWRVVQG